MKQYDRIIQYRYIYIYIYIKRDPTNQEYVQGNGTEPSQTRSSVDCGHTGPRGAGH